MSQLRITRQRRRASARRHGEVEPLPLDPRDPDITRAKQLQRRPGQPSGTLLSTDDLRGRTRCADVAESQSSAFVTTFLATRRRAELPAE
jgi:hypothetical protein